MKMKDSSIAFCFVHFLLLILFARQVENDSNFRSGSVDCKNKKCVFRPDVIDWDSATAVGTFNDTLLTTGWGILDISSGFAKNGSASNSDIMYAAGFLEGVLTASQMEPEYHNLRNAVLPQKRTSKLVKKIEAWFIKQRQWTDTMVSKYQDEDPMWRHVGYTMAQFDGLFAGYKSVRNNTDPLIDQFAVSLMNAMGDLDDMMSVVQRETRTDQTMFTSETGPDPTLSTRKEALKRFYKRGHCSALVKILPGFEDLFMGHSTWFLYEGTNRVFKHYNVNIDDPDTAARKISFSSYPGMLVSIDDYYTLGSGLVMLQTSISVFNKTLYDKVSQDSLFAWQRVRVANSMAHTGEQWTQIIKRYNSGTYNNEYVVVDLKRFTPNQPLPDGTLWVADQMPGLVVAGDATDVLRAGYFPSYNVPFFEEIFQISGYASMAKKHGPEFSYDLAPRAKIFRRDHPKVTDLNAMKTIMRYNDYLHDSYSGGSPMGAICSRPDLVPDDPDTGGCYDTKVTDFAMAKSLKSDIINGPTLSSGLPVFTWTGQFAHHSHRGLPQAYNFSFVRTQPRFT